MATILQIAETTNKVLESTTSWVDRLTNGALIYGQKALIALLIYFVGSWIIKRIVSVVKKIFEKKDYDPSLETFLLSLIKVTLSILLILTVIQNLGVDITSFAAILAGAGLAIGAALNGSLGNLAGGVMLLIFKPFKMGDMIEAQGHTGVVNEIGIFCTTMLSAENKVIILPNGPLSTGVISNYTIHGNLRVDLVTAISTDQDIDIAKKIALEVIKSHPKVLKNPPPEVNVLKVGDGMVTLALRPYSIQSDYWEVFFGVQEQVKIAFDKNNVEGPTPTRVVINK
jgi:small conductance mechanosensitive channel